MFTRPNSQDRRRRSGKMLSRAYLSLLILVLLTLIAGCGKTAKTRPLILTSIHPYELLLKDMVGDDIDVMSIIPANASPHTWSPNPADLRAVEDADLILINGLGLENVLEKTFKRYPEKIITVADLVADQIIKEHVPEAGHAHEEQGHELEEEHEHEHHHGDDPHLWTSPKVLARVVTALNPLLQKKFPAYKDSLNARSGRLVADLNALDAAITKECLEVPNKAVITYHNSFGYFFRDYGIANPASVQSSPGKEPTPRELNKIGSVITEHSIKAIYIEPQMSRKSAEILAREFNLQILTLDPLGTTPGTGSTLELIRTNWNAMKQGMLLEK